MNSQYYRTIQHPGFEFREIDLSIYKEYGFKPSGLFFGVASQGPTHKPITIKSVGEFLNIFGDPQSEAEFYLYKGVQSYVSAENTATVIRIPYNNELNGFDIIGQKKYKALKYTIKTDNKELIDYKTLFENETTFKNLTVEPTYISDEEIEAYASEKGNDFVIYNKYNAPLRDGEELLISVLGRSNAITHQGFIAKAAQNVFNYDEFYFVNSNKSTVAKQSYLWESDTIESINKNLLQWVPEIKTVLKQDKATGFYNKFIRQSGNENDITVIVSKICKSVKERGKYTIRILETFSGSLFEESIDPVSQESNYIGDIINGYSEYVGFVGRKSYKSFKKNTDEIFVRNITPFRFNTYEKSDLIKNIPVNNVEKIFEIIFDLIKGERYTDIFECGIATILSESVETTNGFEFNPNIVVEFDSNKWMQIATIFGHYAKYKNPFCEIYLDAPRSLTLKGQLSKVFDLLEDEEDVINAEKLNNLMLQDNSFVCGNVVWLKVVNTFTMSKQYIPSSCLLANVVSKLKLPFDVPAGINNASVGDVNGVSIIPSPDLKDILYKHHFNYVTIDNRNKLFFDGNINFSTKDYQFNRINVRRLINYLKICTIDVGKEYIGKENNIANRNKFKEDLSKEFESVKLLGGLEDYKIDVGTDINIPIAVESGELRVRIIVKPVSVIEFVLADFIITKTGIPLVYFSL